MPSLTLPMPPNELRFMHEDDERFLEIGRGIVADLDDLCGLNDDASVLDVGSGYGRVAHALWNRDFAGRYLGLEILPRHVAWCHDNITPASEGRLRFAHLDVRNSRYNPSGTTPADAASFGVDDDSIDVAVLTSVFTHMYPNEVRRYFTELSRVVRPGGRVLATFFTLDDTWREAEAQGRAPLAMPHELEPGCRFHNADDPLHAIGYDSSWIRQTAAAAGLEVFACRLGTWCGRPAALGYQDTWVFRRP